MPVETTYTQLRETLASILDRVVDDREIVIVRRRGAKDVALRDPFSGPGKPEPLKYVLTGCWSRRITQEHRLVYRVSQDRIDFLQARYHY